MIYYKPEKIYICQSLKNKSNYFVVYSDMLQQIYPYRFLFLKVSGLSLYDYERNYTIMTLVERRKWFR